MVAKENGTRVLFSQVSFLSEDPSVLQCFFVDGQVFDFFEDFLPVVFRVVMTVQFVMDIGVDFFAESFGQDVFVFVPDRIGRFFILYGLDGFSQFSVVVCFCHRGNFDFFRAAACAECFWFSAARTQFFAEAFVYFVAEGQGHGCGITAE